MVHALELIWKMLKRDGVLIETHPSGAKPSIGVRSGEKILPCGILEETDDFIEYFQAEEALANVASRGWFRLERRDDFHFIVLADTPDEFVKFLNENYSDAILKPEVYEKLVTRIEVEEHGGQVEMDELGRISRYMRGEEVLG